MIRKGIIMLFIIYVSCITIVTGTTSRFQNENTLFAELSYREVADNVSKVFIGSGSVPGSIILTETRAFAMVLASDTTIVGAGGSLNDVSGGRVAAFTHGSFIHNADSDNGLGNMMFNIAKWGGQTSDPRVAFQSDRSELTDLGAKKFGSFTTAPAAITDTQVLNGELKKSNYDILFAQSDHYNTDAEMQALRDFLEEGGGLVFYGTSWAYDYPNGFDYELDYPANIVISGTGISILGGIDWSYTTGPWDVPVNLTDPISNNAGYAIEALLLQTNGDIQMPSDDEATATDSVIQAMDEVMDSRANLTSFFSALDDLRISIKNTTTFTYPSRSVTFDTEADSMATFLVFIENEYAKNLPASDLESHPAHVDFPGEVPTGAVPLADEVLTIRGTYEGLDTNLIYAGSGADRWTSTALYLVAGTTMTVTLPSGLINEGISVLVGCHTDNLSSKTSLNRMPQISRSWKLDKEITMIGSAFGGLVYVVVPWGAELADFNVTISGAVRSLQYTHNVTSPVTWQEKIGSAPSNNFDTSLYPPWGELVSDKYVMTLQTSVLLTVSDPVSVMNYWDSVVDAEDTLLGYPALEWRGDVGRAERMVVDVQISAGWMHSGYPWMAYDSVSDEMVDVQHLFDEGEWGPYHELGHNHQYKHFVVMDSTEVSCNFFSAYIQEAINGNPSFGTESIGCEQEIREYLAAPDYEGILAGDVWMHLNFFLLIKHAFGWGVIQKSLSSYVDGSDTTDYSSFDSYERVDPLLFKLSVNSGRNLVPYAEAWDYPLTDDGAAAINALNLPDWDFDSTLSEMEITINPARECYTPVNERYTLVEYNDPLLGNNTNMWHYTTYRGILNTTESGRTCQRWDAQSPHSHSYGPDDKPCRGTVDNNYCRTNGEDRPWCYTTDPDVRWEFCNLPVCTKMSLLPSKTEYCSKGSYFEITTQYV